MTAVALAFVAISSASLGAGLAAPVIAAAPPFIGVAVLVVRAPALSVFAALGELDKT